MSENKNLNIKPTDEEGKEVKQTEEQKLMNWSKKELIEELQKQDRKHKSLLTRNKKTNEKLEELKKYEEQVKNLQQRIEDVNEEAAQMSETIRRKNTLLNEAVHAYQNLVTVVQTTMESGLKILEYNGLLSNNQNNRGGQ